MFSKATKFLNLGSVQLNLQFVFEYTYGHARASPIIFKALLVTTNTILLGMKYM
jgi:hypothetical protein